MSKDNFDDFVAIRKVMECYVKGGVEGKSEIMKKAFHADAIMYGQHDGKLSGGPIQNLYDFVDNSPAAKDMKAEITAIAVHETIATARVESQNWNGARYSDMFLLVKDGNDWKILTKVFHAN